MTKQSVSIEEVEYAVRQVFNECNGNLPLKFKIRETAEELYGHEAIKQYPELKSAQGAYLPSGDHRGRNRGQPYIYLQSSSILYDNCARGIDEKGHGRNTGIKEAIRVVRHEILGHYGINTCSAEQKLNILQTIVKNQLEPDLQKVWLNVERDYPDLTKIHQAEEVFSFVAENKPTLDTNFSLISEPFTLKHIEQIAARIAEGIRLGSRTQQIFPANNLAQFYQSEKKWLSEAMGHRTTENTPLNHTPELFSTNYQWSKEHAKMIVSINNTKPNTVDTKVLSRIIANDKFLSCYSLKSVQSGQLDLRIANGIQPVPKNYDPQGSVVFAQHAIKVMKLK